MHEAASIVLFEIRLFSVGDGTAGRGNGIDVDALATFQPHASCIIFDANMCVFFS